MGSRARKTIILAATSALLAPGGLSAQSCALCYQSAAASGAQFIQGLRNGILILLFPPLLIGFGLALLAYRKRDPLARNERVPVEKIARRMAAGRTATVEEPA